eukprot:514629-Prorocentrum_minimum.AAC.1
MQQGFQRLTHAAQIQTTNTITRSRLRCFPLGARETLGGELNSPVAERLNKGLMVVWSPNKVVSANNWAEN